MTFRRLILSICQAFLLLLIVQSLGAKPVYMQVRIFYDSDAELNHLKGLNLDIVIEQQGEMEIIISPDEFEKIRQSGFRTEVIHDDLTAFFQSRLDPKRDMGGYKTLDEVFGFSDELFEGGCRSFRSRVLEYLDLVELVTADHSPFLRPVTSRFLPVARRVRKIFLRKLVLREDLVPVIVDERGFRRREEKL